MLSLTSKESSIFFDMPFYTQVNSAALGSLLETPLAFLCHHETKSLNDCLVKFKAVIIKCM